MKKINFLTWISSCSRDATLVITAFPLDERLKLTESDVTFLQMRLRRPFSLASNFERVKDDYPDQGNQINRWWFTVWSTSRPGSYVDKTGVVLRPWPQWRSPNSDLWRSGGLGAPTDVPKQRFTFYFSSSLFWHGYRYFWKPKLKSKKSRWRI